MPSGTLGDCKKNFFGGRKRLDPVWVRGVMGRKQGGAGFEEKSFLMILVASRCTKVNPFD